jgi:uncharacterized protein (DUF1684 family)
MNRPAILFTSLLLLSACGAQEDAAVESTSYSGDVEDPWEAKLLEERAEKDEMFKTSETSPMAGLQYLMSDPRDTIYLLRKENSFSMAYFPPVPDAVLMINKEIDRWHWYDQGLNVVCQQGDQQMPNGSPLEGSAKFTIDGFTISCNPRENRVSFIIFDAERPEMKSFEHLYYFPPDRAYAVDARLVKISEPDEVTMLTSQNLEKVFYRYAKIEFELEGKRRELTAFKYALDGEGSSILFIPFRDTTTAHESYAAGRYIEFEEPEEENFVLDFNRCFNPLCNYSPAYNCPYPPEENHLQVAIRAGEKTYPH